MKNYKVILRKTGEAGKAAWIAHLAAVRVGARVGLFGMSLLQRQGYVTLTIDRSPGPVCFT
jgi:hypothetical protein